MDSLFTSEKIYSVFEINTQVRDLIKEQFQTAVWVCGEIQGLRPERNKRHTYFELVQKAQASSEIIAKVKVALFAGRKPLIEKRIKETKGAFELKNDIEVKFLCEVSLHPPTGQYSLVVIDVDAVYTLGKVALTKAKIIEDLRKRGLLGKNKLLVLPKLPLNIGLITAFDSAAFHDFTNELAQSGYAFKVQVFNAHMQGKQVESDVLSALKYFNKLSTKELDAIVVSRGGGSTADLSFFDNQKIAESIAGLKFPLISALGHQIDTTVTDLVAHTSCKTPTKAAQFLTERIREQEELLNLLREEIFNKSNELIEKNKKQLQYTSVQFESQSLRYFRLLNEDLLKVKHSIATSITLVLSKQRQFLGHALNNITLTSKRALKDNFNFLNYAQEKIKILDPKNTLKRGYSITLSKGRSIKSIDDIEDNDMITTLLSKGSFDSKVKIRRRNG